MLENDESPTATVDIAVLAGLEQDLADVDAALLAIDDGEPSRSALLERLLAGDTPASAGDPATA